MTSLSYDDFNFRKQHRPPWTFNCILQKYRFQFLFIPHTLSVHSSWQSRHIYILICINIRRRYLNLLLPHYIEYRLNKRTKPTIYYRFNSVTLLCLSQARTCISNAISRGLFFMFNDLKWPVRDGWSLCW